MDLRGTPKTLNEAIDRSLEKISNSDGLSKTDKVNIIEEACRDYLANKFTPVLLKAAKDESPCAQDLLKLLWGNINNENN